MDEYRCIAEGLDLVECTDHGRQCVFCGRMNPDQSHLIIAHRAESCRKRATRQDTMLAHLKKEHACDQYRAGRLALKYYSRTNKTAYTCGICSGELFKSKEEQIQHVEQRHERGMEGWSETTMMRNLLQHPQIRSAWQRIVHQTGVSEQCLVWTSSMPVKVLLELDLNAHTPQGFANAAFQCADTMEHHDGLRTPLESVDEMETMSDHGRSFLDLGTSEYSADSLMEDCLSTGSDLWATSALNSLVTQPAQQGSSAEVATSSTNSTALSMRPNRPGRRTWRHPFTNQARSATNDSPDSFVRPWEDVQRNLQDTFR